MSDRRGCRFSSYSTNSAANSNGPHRFVRYAEDCNIHVRSQRAGRRVMHSVTGFLARRLKLKANETKGAVARPGERKFLGFSFSDHKEPKRASRRRFCFAVSRKSENSRDGHEESIWNNDEGTSGLLTRTEQLLRLLSDPLVLEAVETWKAALREATPPRVGRDLAAQTAGNPLGPVLRASHRLLRLAWSPSPVLGRCVTL